MHSSLKLVYKIIITLVIATLGSWVESKMRIFSFIFPYSDVIIGQVRVKECPAVARKRRDATVETKKNATLFLSIIQKIY